VKSLRIITLAVLCAFVLTATAFAQAEKKIGVLDLSKTFDNYAKTKEYDATLENLTKSYEKERNDKIGKIKEAEGKLALMKEEEKAKAQKDIDQMTADLQAFDQAKVTDLRKQRDDKIREILLEIEKVVSDFAKKEKFDLILNDRVLIYSDPGMNVSDQILKILNDNYNKK
jgi:outer membrane protein